MTPPDSAPQTAPPFLRTAVATGLLEVAIVGYRKVVDGALGVHPDFLWLAPLAHVIASTVAGLVPSGLARRLRVPAEQVRPTYRWRVP